MATDHSGPVPATNVMPSTMAVALSAVLEVAPHPFVANAVLVNVVAEVARASGVEPERIVGSDRELVQVAVQVVPAGIVGAAVVS